MALNLAGLCDELAVFLGTGKRPDDPIRVSFTRWINQVCRRIAYAYPWDEMRDDQTLRTVGPYTDGTVTATLDSTTITGSGTTWTAAMEGRKFTLAQGGPFYRLLTWVSATQFTLAEAYAGTTVAGSAYTIYQDEYDLATNTHAVEDIRPIIDSTAFPSIRLYEQGRLDAVDYLGRSTGRPGGAGVCTSTTVGTPRLRIVPVPDQVYRLDVKYLKKWVPMFAPTDLYTKQGLPEDVESLIIDGALRWAPKVDGARTVMTDKDWRSQLAMVWAGHRPNPYSYGARRQIGGFGSPALIVNLGGLS